MPPKPKCKPVSLFGKLYSLRPYQLTLPYIKNNYVYLSFLCLYLLINLVLFVSRAIQYCRYNYYVIIARACGKCAFFTFSNGIFCFRFSTFERFITARVSCQLLTASISLIPIESLCISKKQQNTEDFKTCTMFPYDQDESFECLSYVTILNQ